MARVNVYLPDDLAERVRKADLNVSAVTRSALEAELASRLTSTWLDDLGPLDSPSVTHRQAMDAVDAVRRELERHGAGMAERDRRGG